MKKLLIAIILLFPIKVFAEASYDITDYYIEAYIEPDGDLLVKELFVLDGFFNGYERDLLYTNNSLNINADSNNFYNNSIYNASGIFDVLIKAMYVDEVSFDTMNYKSFSDFTETNYAINGDSCKFIKSILPGGIRYRMYYPSDFDRVAFYLTYTIDNAVVIHNDVAELYWNFIGTDYEDDLNNLNIKVILPKEDNSSNFRIWAHGDLTGEINFLMDGVNKVGAIATMDKVDAYDAVDVRMTFDKSLISDSSNLDHSNITALNNIIEVETERAEVANNLRQELKFKYYITIVLTIGYVIGLVVTFFHVRKKYGVTKKSGFDFEYNREFIDEYNVEVIDYLLNRKNISPNAMSASIMNMIYKKNIIAEEIASENSKKNEYKFTLINEEGLNKTEQKLIQFLFLNVGHKDESDTYTFTTKELRNYASSSVHYSKFISSYTNWKNYVISDGEALGFYENTSKAKIYGLIWLALAILLNILAGALNAVFVPMFFIPYIAIVFLIYTLLIHKKTEKGSLHYDKWMAFKRFLKDFGNFSEKELPEIILWERYLVYAVIFGIADQVEKDMNVKIKEFEQIYGETYYPTLTDIYVYNSIRNSVNYTINQAIRESYSKQAATQASVSSSSSSGGGFGGGFSSGGGFGGGGGGGRGF